MDYKILNILKEYKYLGEKQLVDNTRLIGKALHIAPEAWLHCIFHPLTETDIKTLEKDLGTVIPSDYKDFLATSNGLRVFNTTFTLDGLRKNYSRNSRDNFQPFDITTPNKLEKPKNAGDNVFIIGGYDWDGSYLFIDTETNKVHLCQNEDSTSLYEWKNFNKMLESEITRLIKLFDKNGKELNPDESTLPID